MSIYDLDMLNLDIDNSKKRLNKSFINENSKNKINSWTIFNLFILLINICSFVIYFYIARRDDVINTAEAEILYLLGFVLIVNIVFLFISVISATNSRSKIKKSSSIKKFKSNIEKDIDSFYLDNSLIA